MKIQCPKCETSLKMNIKKMHGNTARARCGHCKHIFRMTLKRFFQTRCPDCQTQLKVPSSRITKNRVRLRCYHCLNVFTYEPYAETKPKDHIEKLYTKHEKILRRLLLVYSGQAHDEIVSKIQAELQHHGHEVQSAFDNPDTRNHNLMLENGFSWLAQDLDRALVLLFMSHETIQRPNGKCLHALHLALDRGFPIQSIRLDDCMPPILITHRPFVDFSNPNTFEQTVHALTVILEKENPNPEQIFDTEQIRFKRLFRPLPFEGMIPGYLIRFSGRADLLDSLSQWSKDPSNESVMMITGNAGTGKTAIAAWFACFSDQTAGFHICRYGDRHMSDPRRWIFSAAYQIALYLPAYFQHLCTINLEKIVAYYDSRSLFDQLLVQPFFRIQGAHLKPIVLVMDGLDQATRQQKNIMAELLSLEWARTPSFLKLLITTRDEPEVTTALANLKPKIINISNTQHDLDARQYITRYMTPYTPDDLSIEQATEIIFERSEGIFLYIEWLRRELAQGRIGPYDIPKLPQGLNGMYTWLFHTQFHDHSDYVKKIRPLLDAMSAAQEPLSLDMITHLIDWKIHDRLTLHNILGMLFSVTDNCFHFFHRSLGDWLRNPDLSKAYTIKEQNGHLELARLGMNAYIKGLEHLPDYMLAHLPFHLCHAQKWDDLAKILTDLSFIEKKCRAGMTYDLVRDFEEAIWALPDCRPLIENQKKRTKQCQEYTKAIMAFARGEAAFPEAVYATQPLSDAAIAAENKRMATSPTRQDRILSFYRFIFSQRHDLARFSSIPGFCLQQAYNYSKSGPVAKASQNMMKQGVEYFILEQIVSHSLEQSLKPALLRTLAGHSSWVICTAMTPDGQFAISGSVDETLRVWSPEVGECLRVLRGHKDIIHDVRITPDGRLALSASQDHTVRLWQISSGQCEITFDCHHAGVTTAALTPDGAIGASADQLGWVHVYHLKEEKVIHSLNTKMPVKHIEISPNGKRLYIAFNEMPLHVWQISPDTQHEPLTDIVIHTSFDITPDEHRIIVNVGDGTAIVWDLASGKQLKRLKGHEGGTENVRITPDGRRAISCGRDKLIRIWDTETGECYRNLQEHTRRVVSVCIRSDARQAISAGLDKTLRVWDIESGKCIQHLETHSFSVNSMCISQDGKTAISGSLDKLICLWDLASGTCKKILEGHTSSVESVNLSATGKWAVTGSRDKTVRVWDIQTGDCARVLHGHMDDVYSVCLSADSKRAVSGSRDKTLRIWDLETGQCLKTLKGHSLTVGSVRLTPDKRYAISGSRDRTLRIWDIETGECLKTLKGHRLTVESIIVNPNGKYLISASRDRTIRVWDIQTGECKQVLLGHTGWVKTVTTTPDGNYIISGSWDCSLRVWDIYTGRCQAVFQTEYGVSALSEVTRNGCFACGTKMGKVILLRLMQIL
jgi:predicted Zn finger-like uncharacterized protein